MIEVAGVGTIRVDIAYGGMAYAMVEAADLGPLSRMKLAIFVRSAGA